MMIKNEAWQVNFTTNTLSGKGEDEHYVQFSDIYLDKDSATKVAKKAKESGRYRKVSVTKTVLWV